MIEVKAASLAASRASEEEIESLSNYLQQMIASSNYKEQFAKIDHMFHKQIILSTHNPIIIKMYQAIEDLLLGQQLRNIELPNAIKNAIMEHQKIFNPLKVETQKPLKQQCTIIWKIPWNVFWLI